MNRAEFAGRGAAVELDDAPFEAEGATQEPEVLPLPSLPSVRFDAGIAGEVDGGIAGSRESPVSLAGLGTAVLARVGGGRFEGIGAANVVLDLPGCAGARTELEPEPEPEPENSFGGELIELAMGGVDPPADPATGKVNLHCGQAATLPNNSSGAISSLPQFGQDIVSGIPKTITFPSQRKNNSGQTVPG